MRGTMSHRQSNLYWLPLICTLIPGIATHLSWFLATAFQIIDPCCPYWSDCVSISRTARQLPVSLVFKGLIIPHALLTAWVWFLVWVWLTRLGIAGKSAPLIFMLGGVAGFAMVVYLLALGVQGDDFRLARRTGVIISFSFTYLAQLLLYRKLHRCRDKLSLNPLIISGQKLICIALLTVGISSLVLEVVYTDYKRWQDAFEWWFALFLYGYFFTLAAAWKQTGFSMDFHLKSPE